MLEGSMVEKLPIGIFVGWFIFYIVTHIIIGLYLNNIKKQYENGNLSLEKNIKNITILFKWYPAIILIIIMISFLNGK